MELLARCSLEESKKFDGRLVIPNEDSSKPDKVYLNVVLSDGDTFDMLSGKEFCVSFCSKSFNVSEVPDNLKGRVFNEIMFEDLDSAAVSNVDGVVNLLKLPQGYCDMLNVHNICCKYPNIRVVGGNLLGVEGVSIGRFEDGKDRMLPVFDGIYDTFVEVDLNDLDGLQEIVRKTRRRAEGIGVGKKKAANKKTGSSSSKPKRLSKKSEVFGKLFGDVAEEEF